jgi:hypothetical protein
MLDQFTGNNMAEAQVKLPTLPLGMKADGVTVTSGGVAVTASGPAAEAHGKASGSSGSGLPSTNC